MTQPPSVAPRPAEPGESLEANLEKSGRVEELIKLYEGRSREVQTPEESAHLLSRAADLTRERLRNPVRAEELFRRALVYLPTSREALEGLRALSEQRSDWGALAESLERLAQVSDGQAAAATYLKAGELYEQKLNRGDRAVLCYRLAARAYPQERGAYRKARRILLAERHHAAAWELLELERAALGDEGLLEEYVAFAEALVNEPDSHALATKALVRALAIDGKSARAQAAQKELSKLEYVWREKVKQLKTQSLEERDRRHAARLSLQVARLFWAYEPSNVPKVKEALDRCFALWPAMPDALALLEQVAEKSGDVRPALAVFAKLAQETRDRTAQVDLHLRIGAAHLTRLGEPDKALAAFEAAVKADPSRTDATLLLAEHLAGAGRAAEALAVLDRHQATLKDRHIQVALRLVAAELATRLLRDAGAAGAQLEAASKASPGNPQVAFRLARHALGMGELERALPWLELAVSAPQPVQERVALCEAAGALCEEKGDAVRAFQVYALALPLAPGNSTVLEGLRAAAEGSAQQPALALHLRRAAQVARESEREPLWRMLGIVLQQLDRPSEAQEAWLEVQRRSKENPEAAEALRLIRKQLAEEPQDPRGKLEAEAKKLEAAAAEPSVRAQVYRRILELDPDSVPTLKKLGLVAAKLGLFEEEAQVAERLVAVADSQAERQGWRLRLAQLSAEKLNRKDEAARLYLNLLAEGAASAEVTTGLERLAAQGVRQADISRALAPLYARAGDYQRQVASLLVQLSSVQDPAEQKSLLSLLADTSEQRLLDERAAIDFRLRGLSLDPTDLAFRGEVVRLSRQLKAQAELARFFMELSTRASEPGVAMSYLVQAAELAEEGQSVDEAAQALTLALQRSPDHPALLSRLSALYERTRRWADADVVLRRELAHAPDGDERREVALRLAQANRELGRPGEAAAALVDALNHGGDQAALLPTLVVLFEQAGQWKDLTLAQERLVELHEQAGDHEAAAAVAVARARVLETHLGDKAEAIRRYGEVLAARPQDADALTALENLLQDATSADLAARALLPAYEAQADHRKQVAALRVIAETSRDSAERIAAYKRAAGIHTLHLRQPDQAFAAWASALRLAPMSQEVRASTLTAAEDADAVDAYAEVLEEILEAGAQGATAVLHRELAEVYEKKLNQHDRAVKHLRDVLALEPNNLEALKALQRLHRSHEEWSELVAVLERLSTLELDVGQKTELDREAARLAEEKLDDWERAAVNWRQIAARDALARDAAQALERLYTELSRPRELAFALELRRNQEGQSPQGREIAFRLAQVRRGQLDDRRGALEVYRQILDEDPQHPGTREALEAWARESGPESAAAMEILDPVLARTGDHARRIALREGRLAGASSSVERSHLSAEIRAILERDLGQPQAAFLNALRTFAAGLERDEVRPELERLARDTGSFEELADVYEAAAETAAEAEKLSLLRRAGELREQLAEPEDAVRVWQGLLALAPQDRQALDSLSRLFEKSQNAKSLAQVYAQKAKLARDARERFELLLKTAEAYEAAGDDKAATETLKTALALKADREVLLALDRLFGRQGRFAEQADTLDRLAEAESRAEVKVGFLLRRAALMERAERWPEGLQLYAQVLELIPHHPLAVAGLERLLLVEPARLEAARLLEPCYRATSEVRKLVEVLDLRLTVTDAQLRLPALLEIATLREALGQKALALTIRLRSFAEAPGEAHVRDELERLAADLGAFEDLAAAYQDMLERGVTEPLAGELWRRLAVIATDRLQRLDLAARAWNEVWQRRPDDVFVLESLSRIYRRTNAFRELAQVMKRQLALEPSVTAQVNLLFELATLAEDTLSDKPLAAQCYQAILERNADDPNAIKFLSRLYAEMERWPELAQLLTREIAVARAQQQEEVALDLMVRLGRLKLGRLSDPRGGLDLFQAVLKHKPSHAGATGALEELARSDSPLRGEAALTLEPLFTSQGQHLKLLQMLEARVAAETDAGDRAALLRRMAAVYSQQMDNAAMAFVTSARALRELPDERQNLELSLSLAGPADAVVELTQLLGEVAPKAATDAARLELYRSLARVQAGHDQGREAVESWQRVLDLAPTDVEAMAEVSRLLAAQHRSDELLEVLKRQAAIEEDPRRRVQLLLQVGAVQEDQLGDEAGALATFRRLLELDPANAEGLTRMQRLCESQQRWPELADTLSKRLKVSDEASWAELTLKLAYVQEVRLLDRPSAIELYRALLAKDPKASAPLQRVLALFKAEPQSRAAFEVVATTFRTLGDGASLAAALDLRVGAAPDAQERKALLLELARLREAAGEAELTYLALFRAYQEDPNDASVRAALVRAAQLASSWDELVAALESELPRITEPPEAATVALIAGQVYEQRLREPGRAAELYERAFQLEPEVGKRGLPALDRLYGQLDRPEDQARILETLAPLVPEAADKVALFFRLGQLWQERLQVPERAAQAFEAVVALDPRNLPSLRFLEALYEQSQAAQPLYRALELQAPLLQGPERERVLSRMAQVASERLDDVDGSVALYRELLSRNPRNDQAFEALAAILERSGRLEELAELLKAKLKVTVDPRELIRLNEKLGTLLWQPLGRPEEAVPFFKAALERDARNRTALQSLKDIFLALDRKDDLVTTLRRLIPLQDDAFGIKQIRLQLAEVLAQTSRREEALDAARRALEAEPNNVAELDRAQAVYAALKAWPDAVRALELKAEVFLQQEEREQAVASLFQVVEVWAQLANRPDNAGAVLRRILEIEPSNRHAYEASLELYASINDWRSYATSIEHYLPHLVTEEEKVAALEQLGAVQETRLMAKHVAFLAYCRALQLSPQVDRLREHVERLADETGSHEELAAVYEEVADSVPRGPLAERMYLTLARVQDEKLDDPEAAEAALRKVLEFDRGSPAALDRLGALFIRRGRPRDYIIALEQKLEAAASIEERKELLKEVARVWAEQLSSSDEAEAAYERALQLEPDLDTLSALGALQRNLGQHQKVASTLLRMRDVAAEPADKARLQVEAAQVYERELKDDETAVENYRAALSFDPDNQEALSSLERLYSRLDRPADLLAVFDRQLELTQDWQERVKILFRCASIWEERYQNLANADACVTAVLEVDPQNLGAVKTLARLKREQGLNEDLVAVQERQLQLETSPAAQADLLADMGEVFHVQLKQVDRAVGSYHRALEVLPTHLRSMHALGTLYERSGNWPFALDMLEREAQALGQTPEAVELYFRAAKINEEMLIDPGNARRCYQAALGIDPSYLPAIRALKGLYLAADDQEAYARALLDEAQQTEDSLDKSRAWVELARYHQSRQALPEAVQAFEEALKLDPQSLDAAEPLADAYLADEKWEKAERMLALVTQGLSLRLAQVPDDPELPGELCKRWYRSGYVAEKRGKPEVALADYEKAYALDSTYLPVLEAYGNLLVRSARPEEAQRVYQSILLHHRGELTDLEVAEIYWTLGSLLLQAGQAEEAQNHFEKALALDSMHEPSLKSMVKLAEDTQAWDRAADYRHRLLQLLDGEARYEVGVALGALAKDKLNDPYMAIDAYLAAHRLKGQVPEVLDALYILYRQTKQPARAVECLEKLLALPEVARDPQRAKRVQFALGELYRDELPDLDKAVAAFNAALDLDFRFMEAFAALEALLVEAKKWQRLDQNYRRMIERFPKTDETKAARLALWKTVADLYLNVLKAPDAAVHLYEVVAVGSPEDVSAQETFATLAQTQAGWEGKAAEAWRKVVSLAEDPGPAVTALATLAAQRKDYDGAYLAAQVAQGLLGRVGPGEQEILAKLGPWAKRRETAQRALNDRLWQQHLFHRGLRGPLAELLGLIADQAGPGLAEDFTRFQVNPRKHLIDVAQAPEFQLHHYRYVARLMGFEQVAVFSPFLTSTRERMARRSNEPAQDPTLSVEVLNTHPVSLKLGGRFFSETGQKELYYLLGRTMALLRPELSLSVRLSAERLETLLQAAISLSVERYRFTADPRALEAERKLLLGALSEQARSGLKRLVEVYVRGAAPTDVRTYLEACELTATRAGAFVAGELEPVRRMVSSETGTAYRVQQKAKVREVLLFALSEDLATLRQAVGTSVEVQVR